MASAPKKKLPMVDMHLRIPQSTFDAVARCAKREDRTIQGQIRHAIRMYLVPVERPDADD